MNDIGIEVKKKSCSQLEGVQNIIFSQDLALFSLWKKVFRYRSTCVTIAIYV
jgi:hypothetical protein